MTLNSLTSNGHCMETTIWIILSSNGAFKFVPHLSPVHLFFESETGKWGVIGIRFKYCRNAKWGIHPPSGGDEGLMLEGAMIIRP